MKDLPLLTIGVLSWNRLNYLRATLESAKRCIQYPNIQWIVLDNCSTEPGLAEYLKSLPWIDDLIFMRSTHVAAMNEIVSRAKGEILLLWPEDVQFVVQGDWMQDCVEILLKDRSIGGLSLNFHRRQTIDHIWGRQRFNKSGIVKMWKDLKRYATKFRFQKKIVSSRGYPVRTFGWQADGIIGAGITSLARLETWKTLGPWKLNPASNNIIDSSGGGETEMLNRWIKTRMPLQRALPILPVSADIINDSLGTKAKIRGNKRYGVYTPPLKGDFYYKIYEQNEVADLLRRELPVSFEEFVEPIGFDLPLDTDGNLLKNSLNDTVITDLV
jgi:glycosyltransferase involved in cell wall biosynthesis